MTATASDTMRIINYGSAQVNAFTRHDHSDKTTENSSNLIHSTRT